MPVSCLVPSAYLSASQAGAWRRLPFPRQAGASAISFTIVALPLITLALGTIEIAHWFHTRQLISLALVEAARAASTRHNHPQAMAQAFEQALGPRYTMGHPDRTRARIRRALQRRQQDLSQPWQITMVSPSFSAFQDFADPSLQVPANGQAAIRNSYQAEQHERAISRGWPGGRGPHSGQTVFEANTLVLEAVWPHRPYFPLLQAVLRPLGSATGSYTERALSQGYVPMRRQVTLTMQSNPVRWPSATQAQANTRHQDGISCQGWLCQRTPADMVQSGLPEQSGSTQGLHKPGGSGATVSVPGSGSTHNHGVAPNPIAVDSGHWLGVSPDDPACGVSLCCA